MSQDRGKFRKQLIDKFYTHPDVAQFCIAKLTSIIPDSRKYIWVEPSAGSGAFIEKFPTGLKGIIAMDIIPENEKIIQQDYLKWNPEQNTQNRFIIIGNPPFGRQSKTAKQFIAKSCSFGDVVAFILPRSFVKPSMNRVFPPLFHCVCSESLPKRSFLLNGNPYDVPCVFMVWQKTEVERDREPGRVEPNGFAYVKHTEPHSICIRRVGVYAGQSYKQGTKECSPSSHYFIRFDLKYNSHIDKLIEIINNVKYEDNTVGPRSISKGELSLKLNTILTNYVY